MSRRPLPARQLRAVSVLCALFVLAAAGAAGANKMLPALGLEIEIEHVEAVRYDPTHKNFASVEEKKPESEIFETVGHTPPAPSKSRPLFWVTLDNGKPAKRSEVIGKVHAKGDTSMAGDEKVAKLDLSGTDSALGYAHGVVEIATGPIPFDPAAHHEVRAAVEHFKSALTAACAKTANKAAFASDDLVLAIYNKAIASTKWKDLLKLKKSRADNGRFLFVCATPKALQIQATVGLPLEKLASEWSNLNAAADAIDGSGKPQPSLTAVAKIWLKFVDCADKHPKGHDNFAECKKKGYEGCPLRCNKNLIQPLPHVDLCSLYEHASLKGKIDKKAAGKELDKLAPKLTTWTDLNIPCQLTVGQKGKAKKCEQEKAREALLVPFDGQQSCQKVWGKAHGFSNHDASAIDAFTLETTGGDKLGLAVEYRGSGVSEADAGADLSNASGAPRKFFDAKKTASESPNVNCASPVPSKAAPTEASAHPQLRCVKAN